MNSNPSKERKNKKGGWCYTLSKTSARRKAKRIHNKRIRRELDKDHKDPLSESTTHRRIYPGRSFKEI